MARPPQGQMHPGRQLAVLGLVFVVLYLLVFFGAGAEGSIRDRLHPKLGLDLVGGTQATYVAALDNGRVPPPESMEQARHIIEQRVNALGVEEAEVVIEGDRNIVVSKAGGGDENNQKLKGVGDPARMRFRMIIKATVDASTVAAPTPSASTSAGPSAAPGGSKTPAVKAPAAPKSAAPKAAPSGGQGGGAPAPSTSATPAPSANATPNASTPAPAPGDQDPARVLQQVRMIVGADAWAAAQKLTDPVDTSKGPAATTLYTKFGTLTPEQVSVLPPQMQFNVPTISCKQLAGRPAGAIDDVNSEVVACNDGAKVLLDKAKVIGEDIADATPQIDQQNQWVVSLNFKSEGAQKWEALTTQAFRNQPNDPCTVAAKVLYPSAEHCLVAVVLDKKIVSAPQIQGVLSDQSQIEGDFDANSAKQLADQLKYGALPVSFTVGTAETVSATLGDEYLRAGLLAAGIGLGLVVIYSFFYYRLLGSVITLSLVLSALLTFGALAFLGRAIGFTLTLAGIAGFIVSLGVAADSFVIYFERLKDEIHEGRSPRSAVPRAWARARRTIISANTITILAAVVLYIVSIGAVRGFAFALGLSTILDLVVVFLFRHPIMTMFANTRAFLSPRVSGLGRVLKRDGAEQPAAARTSPAKEA